MARWVAHYGAETARAIAVANGREPALDLTVTSDPEQWASTLGGRVLPTGSVRAQRAWAGLAASGLCRGRLVGAGRRRGAAGEAPRRRARPRRRRSLRRARAARPRSSPLPAPGSSPSTARRPGSSGCGRTSPACIWPRKPSPPTSTQWQAGPFDAVLLDAPCSSTGTIRRHPDIPWLKSEADIAALAGLQRRLIAQAVELTKPGGVLVYCTCSLEPEEGVEIVRDLLDRNPDLRRQPISAAEVYGHAEWLTPDGDLRTLPCHLPDADSRMAGLDGFYAARLRRS